ncbi:MAG: FAD/NAD(P)-binding protein [Chloroflexi bacterium]|nr:FAD/NAD(P)-binding protein [Chloroflexota bacterium]MCL5075439.1 FAD/NAD(P)-binding protein [Chloroflexota bacterium]
MTLDVTEIRPIPGQVGGTLFTPRLAEIVRKEPMTAKETFYDLRLREGRELGHDPGQFVTVSVFGVGEASLSISSSPTKTGSFELCVRAVGDVTNALQRLPVGSVVGIRGPFGRGFPLEVMRGHDIIFVAGGLGLVPLRSLINNVLDERASFGEVMILYGSRTPADILFKDELTTWSARKDVLCLTTVDIGDEAWTGNVGVVTTLFRGLKLNPRNLVAVVVGPPVMFRFVVKDLLFRGVYESRIFLSLERRMKCGVGKCGHCQINGVYVCQEGPVFSYAQLKKLEEARI